MTQWLYCPECAKLLQSKRHSDSHDRLACPAGHFVHYDNPSPTVMGLVTYGDQLLALKRSIDPYNGEWEFPGGFMESGESPRGAVKREVKEETGLDITIDRIFGAYADSYGGDRSLTVTVFLCSAPTEKVILSAENSDYRWQDPAKIGTLAFPAENRALADYLKELKER